MRTEELFKFILERHRIYERKKQGLPKPWTTDPILQKYRFCNVYRELDTVTQWIAENWREKHRDDENIVFAMCLARIINWPPTLADIKYPAYWNPDKFKKDIRFLLNSRRKVFSSAYITMTPMSKKGEPKEIYLAEKVLNPLFMGADLNFAKGFSTLGSLHFWLSTFPGIGSFLAGQVVADLKYIRPWLGAEDWWTFVASGTGSKRGLSRVCEMPLDYVWTEDYWKVRFSSLEECISPMVTKAGMDRMHAQDLQNCLCEFDKYERVRLGQGRPRSLYNGGV